MFKNERQLAKSIALMAFDIQRTKRRSFESMNERENPLVPQGRRGAG
jgi:hypothetical protein